MTAWLLPHGDSLLAVDVAHVFGALNRGESFLLGSIGNLERTHYRSLGGVPGSCAHADLLPVNGVHLHQLVGDLAAAHAEKFLLARFAHDAPRHGSALGEHSVVVHFEIFG